MEEFVVICINKQMETGAQPGAPPQGRVLREDLQKECVTIVKKIIGFVCVLLALLLVQAACLGDSLYVDNRESDRANLERLNLRAEASKNGAIIGLYYTGAQVESKGAENEDYTKVEIGGVTGYMATEYLITLEEAAARYGENSDFGACCPAQVELTGTWKQELALYTETDFASEVLATLHDGDAVRLVGILDTWAYVGVEREGENLFGYVSLDMLTGVGEDRVLIVSGSKADSSTKLYTLPNDKGKVIMSLKNGTACFSLFGRGEGNWRKVRVGGVTGWIKYTQAANLVALGQVQRSSVPYYPLQMQTRADALLHSALEEANAPYMTLGKDMKVEVLAECGDYVYVRTLVDGAGAHDSGDFGYMTLADLKLTESAGGIGIAQADDGDLPVLIMSQPQADAEMAGVLIGGAQVRIVDYTQTDYLQVALGEMKGYVRKDQVRMLGDTGIAPSDRIPQRAFALADIQLRSKPAADAEAVEAVAAQNRVYMLAVCGDWAFVQASEKAGLEQNETDDRTGFIPLDQLNAPASTTHLTAFVTEDKVNLRDEDSKDGQIVGRIRLNERLRVADYGKTWCCVETPSGDRGYVMTEYLTFE